VLKPIFVHAHECPLSNGTSTNSLWKSKQVVNLLLQSSHIEMKTEKVTFVIHFLTLCGHLLVKSRCVCVEAVMAYIINEVLLYCFVAAFATGMVLAAASWIG
jgi:hypothetical protein